MSEAPVGIVGSLAGVVGSSSAAGSGMTRTRSFAVSLKFIFAPKFVRALRRALRLVGSNSVRVHTTHYQADP
jgi:hypothetical protein